jgi:hypothetical protein
MNDTGTQLYDNRGTAEGGLLASNDVGTQLYDFRGMAEGFIGTSGAPSTGIFTRTTMGFGI